MQLKLYIECVLCHKKYLVQVDSDAYYKWKNGEGFIQDLMPELSASDRELLISNTCDDCFDMLFNSGDYE